MVIYHHDGTLYLHQRVPSQEAFDKMAAHPISPKWNKHMAEVLATDTTGERIYIPLELAFSFGEFLVKPGD